MAPDEYAGFMMTLLRLHGFRPDSVADVVSSIKSVNRAAPKRPAADAAAASTIAPSKALSMAAVAYKADGAGSEWHEILAALQLSGMARELAQHCELRELGETECVLRLAPTHRHLQMKPAQDKLQQALREHLGGRLCCASNWHRPRPIRRRRRRSGAAGAAGAGDCLHRTGCLCA